MNKARTVQGLSAAAVANLAVAGFAAAPAGAVTHTPARTTESAAATAPPNAGRALPGLALTPASRRADADVAGGRGFVPKTRAGVKPELWESGCSSHVCIGVNAISGSRVSAENQHFYGWPGGCHVASWFLINLEGSYDRHTGPCIDSGVHYGFPALQDAYLPDATWLCVGFQNVPSKECAGIIGEE
jgi:hypothetical protein